MHWFLSPTNWLTMGSDVQWILIFVWTVSYIRPINRLLVRFDLSSKWDLFRPSRVKKWLIGKDYVTYTWSNNNKITLYSFNRPILIFNKKLHHFFEFFSHLYSGIFLAYLLKLTTFGRSSYQRRFLRYSGKNLVGNWNQVLLGIDELGRDTLS